MPNPRPSSVLIGGDHSVTANRRDEGEAIVTTPLTDDEVRAIENKARTAGRMSAHNQHVISVDVPRLCETIRQQAARIAELKKERATAYKTCDEIFVGHRTHIADREKIMQQAARIAELERENAELRSVMEQVASMPGRDWLRGQLTLAEVLNPTLPGDPAKE